MALDILEWGVIGTIGVAIFLFGPEKGADIAKKLGAARRDLDAATKQLQGMSKELGGAAGTGGIDGLLGGLLSGNAPPAAPLTPEEVANGLKNVPGASIAPTLAKASESVTPAPKIIGAIAATTTAAVATENPPVTSGDRLLVDMARKLGISTQGKTRDNIQSEIIARASQVPPEPAKVFPVQQAEPQPQPQAQETSAAS